MKWKDIWAWVLEQITGKKDKKKAEPELEDYPVGSNTFTWKPGAHTNGKLVVLFPSKMPFKDIKNKWKFPVGTKFLHQAFIMNELGHMLEEMDIRKTHISEPEDKVSDKLNPNGNRPHARGDHSGATYGNKLKVVAKWKNLDGTITGEKIFHVADGAERIG